MSKQLHLSLLCAAAAALSSESTEAKTNDSGMHGRRQKIFQEGANKTKLSVSKREQNPDFEAIFQVLMVKMIKCRKPWGGNCPLLPHSANAHAGIPGLASMRKI